MIIDNEEFLKKIYAKMILFQRYRDTLTINKESIAAHSYLVSMIGNMICKKLSLKDDIRLKVLEMSLFHDIAESYSDDFTYEMKYRKGNEAFKNSLDAVEDGILKEISENVDNDMYELVHEYKERKTAASKIVKLADKYSVLFYCKIENDVDNKAVRKIEQRVIECIVDLEVDLMSTLMRDLND